MTCICLTSIFFTENGKINGDYDRVFVYQRESNSETEEWRKRLTGRYELLDSTEMGEFLNKWRVVRLPRKCGGYFTIKSNKIQQKWWGELIEGRERGGV